SHQGLGARSPNRRLATLPATVTRDRTCKPRRTAIPPRTIAGPGHERISLNRSRDSKSCFQSPLSGDSASGDHALELLQQPVDIFEFLLRPAAFGAAAAQLLLDRLGTLALPLLGHRHIAVIGAAAVVVAAQRIAAFAVGMRHRPWAWTGGATVTVAVGHHHAQAAFPLAFIVARVLARPATAELAGHCLPHLARALLQGLDGLLLRIAGRLVLPLSQAGDRLAHRLVGIGQAGGHLTGQLAELLHQLPKRSAQRLLHPPAAGSPGGRTAAGPGAGTEESPEENAARTRAGMQGAVPGSVLAA